MTTSFCWRSHKKQIWLFTTPSEFKNKLAKNKWHGIPQSNVLRHSWFWIHSLSTFRTTQEHRRSLPCPNVQGHTVHSSSQNWLTQGHSWNMGGTCGRDLSYTIDVFKKGCHRGQPCDRRRALPDEPSWLLSKVRDGPASAEGVCEQTPARNANWESAGETEMC